MNKKPVQELIYLSSSQKLPPYLQGVEGVRWHFSRNTEELKRYLMFQQGEVCVVVRSDFLSLRTVQAFTSWLQFNAKLSFIFIVQTIESAAYQMSLMSPKMLFLFESEGARIGNLVTRRLMGVPVKSRKQERVPVQSQVMLKKSVVAETSPTGGGVQFLREGLMNDFSKGGAQVSLGQSGVRVKDFVSLMYQNRHGRWVSVESQVRWVVSTTSGEQIIGVQFLAVSA